MLTFIHVQRDLKMAYINIIIMNLFFQVTIDWIIFFFNTHEYMKFILQIKWYIHIHGLIHFMNYCYHYFVYFLLYNFLFSRFIFYLKFGLMKSNNSSSYILYSCMLIRSLSKISIWKSGLDSHMNFSDGFPLLFCSFIHVRKSVAIRHRNPNDPDSIEIICIETQIPI